MNTPNLCELGPPGRPVRRDRYREVVLTHLGGGSSLRVPMSHEEFLALGETKHHEYYDGVCVVNPPSRSHVLAGKRLTRILDDHCPAGYTAYPEWGWRTAEGDFQPDVMVAPVDAPDDDQLVVPPPLVVEILSPTTRGDDWGTKRDKYAVAGAGWYWIVDPEGPEIVVLHNEGGRFVEAHRIGPAAPGVAEGPFPVPLDPLALFA